MMGYNRLNFAQYFIESSDDFNNTMKIRHKPEYNHVEYKWLFFKFSAEWECHYDVERNVIMVCFEQTRDFKDWIVNLLFTDKVYGKFIWEDEMIQLKACKGWKGMYFAMKHQVRDAVRKELEKHPGAEVEVIGWSLGSALAQLAAQDLNYNLGIRPYMYTSGSVKPWRGKKSLNRMYLSSCCKGMYNFMHRNDLVCYLPPFIGFFATNPVKLGKLQPLQLPNIMRWHCVYDDDTLYEGIK